MKTSIVSSTLSPANPLTGALLPVIFQLSHESIVIMRKTLQLLCSITILAMGWMPVAYAQNQSDAFNPISSNDIDAQSWQPQDAINNDIIPLAPNHELATEMMRLYEGSWEGTMQLSNLEGEILNEFRVQQEYWWDPEDNTLKGLAVFDDQGILRYAQSDSYIKDGILYSKVEENQESKLYKARIELSRAKMEDPLLQDYELIWMPLQRDMTLDHQLQVIFENTADGFIMHNKGYERYTQGAVQTWIMLNGKLKRLDV